MTLPLQDLVDLLTAKVAEMATARDELVILTSFMAAHDYESDTIAWAVEQPWRWTDELAQAIEDLTGRTVK